MSSFQDLGGSQYRLRALDEFSAIFDRLDARFRNADKNFALLQARAAQVNNQTSKASAPAQTKETNESAKQNGLLLERLQILKANQDLLNKNAKLNQGLIAEKRKEARDDIADFVRSAQVRERDAAIKKRVLAQQVAEQKRAAKEKDKAARDAAKDQQGLTGFINDSVASGQKLLFTFRRLVGVLAIFQAARTISSGLLEAVVGAVKFNAQLEDSRTGIAGLELALGKFRDASSGKFAEGPEAFKLATADAQKQLDLLRRDALAAGLDFATLADNFQIALGQGVPAGLKTDEIRKFTVSVTQAAAAVGVAQNQLAEEIRSLLIPGAATIKNSRIFTTLGFTRDQIETARQQGKLFEVIQGKLAAFAIAADQSSNSFSRLLAKLKAVATLTGGDAATGFFESLKGLLTDLIGVFGTFGTAADSGLKKFTPNPAVLSIFKELFTFLDGFIIKGRETVKSLNFTTIGNSVADFFSSLKSGTDTLLKVGSGILTVITPTLKLVELLLRVVDALGPAIAFAAQVRFIFFAVGTATRLAAGQLLFFGSSIAQVANAIDAVSLRVKASIVGVTTTAKAEISGVTAAAEASIAATGASSRAAATAAAVTASATATKVLTTGQKITGVLSTIAASLNPIALGLTVAVLGLDQFLSVLLDADFTMGDLVDTIKIALPDAINAVINDFRKLKTASVGFVKGLVADVAQSVGATSFAGTLINEIADAEEAQNQRNKARAQEIADRNAKLEKIIATARGRVEGNTDLGAGFDKAAAAQREQEKKIADIKKKAAEAQRKEDDKQKTKDLNRFGIPDLAKQFQFEANAKQIPEDDKRAQRIEAIKLGIQQSQIDAQDKINQAKKDGFTGDRLALKETQANLEALNKKLLLTKAIGNEELFAASKRLELDRSGVNGPEAKTQATLELKNLTEKQLKEEKAITQEIDAQTQKKKEEADVVSGSLLSGLAKGIQGFKDQFASEFQAGINIATDSLNQFSAFVTTTIIDAFDPTKDVDLKERFGRFLQGIATTILQNTVNLGLSQILPDQLVDAGKGAAQQGQAATTAATLSAGGTSAGAALVAGGESASLAIEGAGIGIQAAMQAGALAIELAALKLEAAATAAAVSGGAGAAAGAAQGGLIGLVLGGIVGLFKGGQAGAKGYSSGGGVKGGTPSGRHYGLATRRPKGLHPSDTQAVWLGLGEFVEPVKTVMNYGADLFEAFRRGRIDPIQARSLLNNTSVSPRRVKTSNHRMLGMASGGAVGVRNSIGHNTTRTSRDGGMTILPVLVSDRQNIDRIISSDNGRAAGAENQRVSSTLTGALNASRG